MNKFFSAVIIVFITSFFPVFAGICQINEKVEPGVNNCLNGDTVYLLAKSGLPVDTLVARYCSLNHTVVVTDRKIHASAVCVYNENKKFTYK